MSRNLSNYSKCKRYLQMVARQNGTELNESASSNSVYLKLHGRTIRLSDHYTISTGNQGAGFVSIISPQNKSDQFVVMLNGNASMSILTYKEVREMVRKFSNIPEVFGSKLVSSCQPEPEPEKKRNLKEMPAADKKTSILGIPKEMFTPGQLNIIRHTAAKVAKENGYKFKL